MEPEYIECGVTDKVIMLSSRKDRKNRQKTKRVGTVDALLVHGRASKRQ